MGDRKFSVKLFADGADPASMIELSKNPKVAGFTTNPSLMKKAGVKDYRTFCRHILENIKDKPISFEVFADDFPTMKRQALEISAWGENVYVKIPITNCERETSAPLVRELSHRGVRLNVTAILTLEQVQGAAQALKGGEPSVISVFAGRIADTGRDPEPILKAAAEMVRSTDNHIELLWASTREIFNVLQADRCGCHIITVPHDFLSKLSLLGEDLHKFSLDTVRQFKKDADLAGFSL